MSGPIRSLIIKEWHEQKWRCASLSAIGLSVVVFAIVREPEVAPYFGISMMGVLAIIGAVFIAMGVAAGERATGTLELLRSLPIRMPQVAAIKLAAGLISCLVPILLIPLAFAVWLGLAYLFPSSAHPTFSDWIDKVALAGDMEMLPTFTTLAMGCCLQVFLWVIAAGINQRTEVRVGVIGIGVLIGWALAIVLTEWIVSLITRPSTPEYSYLLALTVGTSPFACFVLASEIYQYIWPVVAAQAAISGLLALWIICRYSRVSRHDNASPTTIPVGSGKNRFGRPRRSAMMAIAWKQWRDTLPIALLGLAVIMFFVADPAINAFMHYDKNAAINEVSTHVIYWIGYESRTVGILLALIVGIGTFVGDYQSAILTFWRSRPISPRLWFWSKYLTGLLIVELTMIAPWLITQGVMGERDLSGSGPGYLVTVMVVYWFIYTVSVWMACLLRHVVYAGILSGGIVLLVLMPPIMEPSLRLFSIETAQYRLGSLGFADRIAGIYLPWPFLLWMLPPTLLGLWLATRAARRESAFVFER